MELQTLLLPVRSLKMHQSIKLFTFLKFEKENIDFLLNLFLQFNAPQLFPICDVFSAFCGGQTVNALSFLVPKMTDHIIYCLY